MSRKRGKMLVLFLLEKGNNVVTEKNISDLSEKTEEINLNKSRTQI